MKKTIERNCEDLLNDLALEYHMRSYMKPGDPNSVSGLSKETGEDWRRALLECIW